MATPIILEVKQDLDRDGWEDEEGTVHYDDRVVTPWGELGELKTRVDGDDLVIDRASYVILVSKADPQEWKDVPPGASVERSAYGSSTLSVEARNGKVRYQVIDRDVEWSDQPGETINCHLAVLADSHWVKETND